MTVWLLDQNDEAPQFSESRYSVAVAEDSPPGTAVILVEATDQDGTAPNNEVLGLIFCCCKMSYTHYMQVVYRLEGGARDKFVIDPQSGLVSNQHYTPLHSTLLQISVSEGAVLDPDLASPPATQHNLTVTALDGGLGR